jgi:hypothetical protein
VAEDPILESQIANERSEIENAPKVPLRQYQPTSGLAGRCHWCGRISSDLVLVEGERYKGRDCCGGRHA